MKSLTTKFFRKNYLDTRPLFITTLFFFLITFNQSTTKHTTQSATTDTTDQTGWSVQGDVTKENFKGDIKLVVRESKSDWGPYTQKGAPEGSPNVLFVLFDDKGLAVWSPFGRKINIPTLQKLAHRCLTDSQWHITAPCSSTRPGITETANGFPVAHDRIPEQTATIGQILKQNGWGTFLISEDHNVPEQDIAFHTSCKQRPTHLGFDSYSGFLGGETNQLYPDLVEDNYFTEALYDPEQGYHLSKGLTNKSSCFYRKTSISRSAERSTNSFK